MRVKMSPNSKELEEKLDPRVKRTRSLILQAFGELLTEKGFEAISVQDITDKAEINRATFYKHFVVPAILEENLIQTFSPQTAPPAGKPVDKLALIVLLFNIKEPLTL
jgi:hypothetical protein